MSNQIKQVETYLEEVSKVVLSAAELAPIISEIINVAVRCLKAGGTVFWCGNGGSAADSQHLAAELVGRYKIERPPIRSIALTTDTSVLTAISNDFGFEYVYSRQLEALAQEGDVLIALSTSGSSENIVKAIQTAKDLKVISVLFTSIKYSGSDADYILRVACTETDKIQPVHTAMGHIFCDLIEQGLRET